ncbi:hypothetical protein [Paenibacillus xylanexedens]|uniref:hypothetical protein n=1 Tax=Paenibacillus xylanexedens TaxID=528191 RepID=UPI0011A049BC|nr:hypothetical protein [Paenibacillus xylanexedens]
MPNLKVFDGKKNVNNVIPIVKPTTVINTDTTCGCGKAAEFEVYGGTRSKQGHCLNCMLEAVDNKYAVNVRKIGGGGYDDAS